MVLTEPMIRELTLKPDFAKTIARFEAWWFGEILDRAPVTVSVLPRRKYGGPISSHRSWRDRWLDAEFNVAQSIAWMEQMDWVADSFPVFAANLGPEITSTLFGCELEFGETTSWSRPIVHDPRDWEGIIAMKPDFANTYWQTIERSTELAIEQCAGRYVVGLTDLHGSYDMLCGLREPMDLCMDLVDCAELIERAGRQMAKAYVECFNRQRARLAAAGFGSTTWLPMYHEGAAYVPSCDFWCMVSPQIARERIFPTIVEEMKPLARSIFHLDGPQALKHFEVVLELPNLHAVQWVYGAGRGPAARWLDVYRRIRAARKSLQLIAATPADALDVMNEIGARGVWVTVEKPFDSVGEAERFLEEIAKCK